MALAYCAFHNGDYKKAMDIYDEISRKGGDYDRNVHVYKSCCLYALCQYPEAHEECLKSEGVETALKNRLMFHLAHKMGDENSIMQYH